MCFYYDLIVVTRTANYGTCNFMALFCGGHKGGRYDCIKLGVTDYFDDLLNMDGATRKLQKRERSGERCTEKLTFRNRNKSCARDSIL